MRAEDGLPRVLFGAALLTAMAATGAQGAGMRDYRAVAISAGGESVAAIESGDPGIPGRRGHGRIVVRAAASEYDWTPDGRGFVATSAKGNGDNNWWVATLGHVDIASGALRVIAAPNMQVSLPHVSPDGRSVAGRLPALEPITRDNEAFAPQVSARSIGWTNEGMRSQGWLVGPRKPQAGVKHPMIVLVHGGPASAATPRFVAEGESGNPLVRELTARGFYVFQPNPRGSYGQGLAFGMANRRDFGGGDWRDILAGVDAVLREAPVDGARLGLMGHSYGGFMTMWGITHSDRFKAAVAGAGIANWVSYYGQNGIDQWMVPFFGATMYDAPAIYRAASPIESIRNAKTPTLLYVGERDVETPAVQSMEFWHGLRAMGTPTALVIYDGEGHAIRKPEHQLDQRRRTLEWFERYLK